MDPLFDLLGQLGLGLATNAIYDLLKLTVTAPADREHLEQQIENQIRLHGVTMKASTVIEAVAQHGFITIQARTFTPLQLWRLAARLVEPLSATTAPFGQTGRPLPQELVP